MYCRNCGKEIKDSSAFCSECGAAQSEQTNYQEYSPRNNWSETYANVPYNTMCIIGAVISGISLFFSFLGLTGIAGIILSGIGLRQIRETGERGKGLAIAGMVVGGLTAIYGIIAVLIYLNILTSFFHNFIGS